MMRPIVEHVAALAESCGALTWPLIIANALAYLWCAYQALA
jgi:hypothetical protein